jgi:hypothetical protein
VIIADASSFVCELLTSRRSTVTVVDVDSVLTILEIVFSRPVGKVALGSKSLSFIHSYKRIDCLM